MPSYRMIPTFFLLGVALLKPEFAAANDACTDSISVNVGSLPFATAADLTGMTPDFANPTDNLRNFTCGISPEGVGIWYHIVVGSNDTSALLEATISDAPGTDTKFNVALFEGTSCDDMECLLAREYQLENQRTEPRLTWFAQQGMSYYLHVAGINANEVGPFNLDIVDVTTATPSDNDSCSAPEELVLGAEATTVNTLAAWPHGLENDFCSLHAYSRGHFYQVTTAGGEGVQVTLEGETLPDDVRLEIAVLEEGCDTCVAFSEFLTVDDLPHSIEFAATPGTPYVIVVSGERFSDVGIVQIKVDELESVSSTAGKLEGAFDRAIEATTGSGAVGTTFATAFGMTSMMVLFSAMLI
ncbi:expressed unknown protein [Seminavis robusta]|uniref:Uncharacterized protein n=1 Tax=Seminavis robusta TaxID=568900 RepID=A0A9N8I0T5_9STRA|nr:expressed unknown protein [Seminavis robusta]|eukprot:Sro2878_g339190.1 n/a (356) ;mRNA; r:4280-5542